MRCSQILQKRPQKTENYTYQLYFGVGLALLLPRFFGLDGVLYSMPVSDFLTFAIALFLIAGTYRELGGKQTVKGMQGSGALLTKGTSAS